MASKPSRDQKRKKKLEERRKKSAVADAVVPYEGNKYRDDKFAMILFNAECSIREVDELSGKELTDPQVKASLEYLVRQLRGEDPEIPEGALVIEDEDQEPEDYLSAHIRDRWDELQPKLLFRPARADLGGVLRTIISSLNTRTRVTPGGRGYLEFLEPFLEKAGFEAQSSPSEDEHIHGGDDLWRAGHTWVMHGDAAAREDFVKLAEQYAGQGKADDVAHMIEHLEHHTEDQALAADLQQIRLRISAKAEKPPEAAPAS